MFLKSVLFATIIAFVASENDKEEVFPGIHRIKNDDEYSKGYKIIFGDQDFAALNEAVSEYEKNNPLEQKKMLREAIKPLPAEDVKCLMSVDRYCSTEMRGIKGVLVQALKNNCEKCSNDERDKAGRVAASMMAYDQVAWKLFLTRFTLEHRPRQERKEVEQLKLKLVGEPEFVKSKYRYITPGAKVRVKRYLAEIIP